MPTTGGTARTRRERTAAAQRIARLLGAGVGLAAALGGCSNMPDAPSLEPLREPKAVPAENRVGADAGDGPTIAPTPGVVIQRTISDAKATDLGSELVGEPVTVSFHDVPLVAFINEVFAEQLGMDFHIGPGLQGRSDLVTLKLTEPIAPRELFAAARTVLREYGVEIVDRAGILSFVAQADFTGEVPLLISGRAQPEVPVTHRTIFQFVPLKVAYAANVEGTLLGIFDSGELDVYVQLDGRLLLRGAGSVVAQAVDIIDVLDQPLLRGRYGAIVDPALLEVEAMAEDLARVLVAEGYDATTDLNHGAGAVLLLPMAGINKLVVFAWDQSTLEHVKQWADLLDERRREAVAEGIFSYQVRNTQAASLAEALAALLEEGQLIVDKNRKHAAVPRCRQGMGAVAARRAGNGRTRAVGADRGADRRDHA